MTRTPLHAAADALLIRDAAGAYYVVTAEMLDQSCATAEQRTALIYGCDEPHRRGLIANDLRDRQPFQVLGVAVMPLPAAKRENPFWPGIFE